MTELRHPATLHLLRFFTFDHLPEPMKTVSRYSCALANAMVDELEDGPELTFGLRQLLLAKDAFVRASVPVDD